MLSEIKIGIIGLGSVGFPLACLFAKKYSVVGYDIKEHRIQEINAGIDSTNEVSPDVLKVALANGMKCTTSLEDLKECNVYVVAIPTPVDDFYNPACFLSICPGRLSSCQRACGVCSVRAAEASQRYLPVPSVCWKSITRLPVV